MSTFTFKHFQTVGVADFLQFILFTARVFIGLLLGRTYLIVIVRMIESFRERNQYRLTYNVKFRPIDFGLVRLLTLAVMWNLVYVNEWHGLHYE